MTKHLISWIRYQKIVRPSGSSHFFTSAYEPNFEVSKCLCSFPMMISSSYRPTLLLFGHFLSSSLKTRNKIDESIIPLLKTTARLQLTGRSHFHWLSFWVPQGRVHSHRPPFGSNSPPYNWSCCSSVGGHRHETQTQRTRGRTCLCAPRSISGRTLLAGSCCHLDGGGLFHLFTDDGLVDVVAILHHPAANLCPPFTRFPFCLLPLDSARL